MINKYLAALGVTAALALSATLPAAAASRHSHQTPTSEMSAPVGEEPGYIAAPRDDIDANPTTAGSNCGSNDCSTPYNRLNSF